MDLILNTTERKGMRILERASRKEMKDLVPKLRREKNGYTQPDGTVICGHVVLDVTDSLGKVATYEMQSIRFSPDDKLLSRIAP